MDASTLWALKQDKVTSTWDLKPPVSHRAVCKGDRKADGVTSGRMSTGLRMKHAVENQQHYVMSSAPTATPPCCGCPCPLPLLLSASPVSPHGGPGVGSCLSQHFPSSCS